MPAINYSKRIPVRADVDVFVAGGGPSGMAAAITAARRGAKVFLVEALGAFGGMGGAAGLPFLCVPTNGEGKESSSAFFDEIYARLWAAGGAGPEMKKGEHPASIGGFIYDPEVMKRVYDDMAIEAGIRFSFNTSLIDVSTKNSKVFHALCSAKSGIFAVKAKVFIDATGDGDLAAMAGASFEKGDEEGLCQASTLCSLWTGVDWAKKGIWRDGAALPRAVAEGVFAIPDPGLPGILRSGVESGWGNVGHVYGVDGVDERSLTKAMIQGRRLALEYERYYRGFVPGCENARMLWTAMTLGVRESRRIVGDYQLNVEDFKRRASFDDEIGRYWYPVDLHATKPEDFGKPSKGDELFKALRYAPGESYGIPYRCLLPKGLDNVLVAGRCVSVDRYMQGSIRVQPGCYITGQAAGMAAALAADAWIKPRELDVNLLRRELKALEREDGGAPCVKELADISL